MIYSETAPLAVPKAAQLEDVIPTLEEVIEAAVRLDPVAAIRSRKDSDASILHVRRVRHEGKIVNLRPYKNRHGKEGEIFIYVRVSSPRKRDVGAGGEGWSPRTQVERGVYYALSGEWQFSIFSDQGLSGGMPTNNAELIRSLWQTRANVYRQVFKNIFLPEHYKERPNEEKRALTEYMDGKYQQILEGRVRDETDLPEDDQQLYRQLVTVGPYGHEKHTKVYRPALTALLDNLRDASLFVVTDASRVARSLYLMEHVVQRLHEHQVATKGLIEDWDWPNQDGLNGALAGSVLTRLAEDTIRSAMAGSLRGIQMRLEQGLPHGKLPMWYLKLPTGRPCEYCGRSEFAKTRTNGDFHFCEARAEHIRIMVKLYLDPEQDLGYNRTAQALTRLGIPTHSGMAEWAWVSVRKTLGNPALIGLQREFGLLWPALERVISDEDWTRLQHKFSQGNDRSHNQKVAPPPAQPRHLLTGLLVCACGTHMGFDRIHNTKSDNYACGKTRGARVDKTQRHARLVDTDVESFFESIFREYPTLILSQIKDQDALDVQDRMDNARTELVELKRQIPIIEAEIRQEVEEKIRATGLAEEGTNEYEGMILNGIRSRMRDTLAYQASLEQGVEVLRQRIRLLMPRSFKSEVEERIKAWDATPIEDKNAFLRTYFLKLQLVGEHGGTVLIAYLRDGVTTWPPIQLDVRPNKRTIYRRMPPVADYVASLYVDVLHEAGEA